MVKSVVLVVLQVLLFVVVFAAGSFLPALGVLPMYRVDVSATRYMVVDGIVAAAVLWGLIAAIEAVRKRFRAAGLTTLAFVLAAALGLAMKFGFVNRPAGF